MTTANPLAITADGVLDVAGRRVAYRRHGPEGAPVVLYLHGCPGSRAETAFFSLDLLEEIGLQLVGVDRPGYGGSDAVDDLSITERVNDIERVCDHMGVDDFSMIGTSAGGSYAVAAAGRLGGRVRGAVLVAGQGRLDTPWAFDDMQPDFAEGWRAELDDPDASRKDAELVMRRLASESDVVAAWAAEMSNFPDDELATLSELASALEEDTREAARQGGVGYWLDSHTRARPWPIHPADVRCPLYVFHGTADTWNPWPSLRRSLAGAPDVRTTLYPHGNHLSPWVGRGRRAAILTAAASA